MDNAKYNFKKRNNTPSFDYLVEYKTLLSAWRVVANKGSHGGIDGISIADFEKDLGSHIGELRKRLKEKTWKPQPYLTISIPKKDGERRKLGLLSIKDKIVQQALKQILEYRFENTFSSCVCAYRQGYGHAKAMRKAKAICMDNAVTHLVRIDIDNYFDSIDHTLLFKRLTPVVVDQELLRLIDLCVKIGMVDSKMKWENITKGVPQGAVLSPLLANYYLVPFDQFILSKSSRYVRYADDFLIGCESEEEAKAMVEGIITFLRNRLILEINPPIVASVDTGVEFLGLHIDNSGLDISEDKEKELIDNIMSVKWSGDGFDNKSFEKLENIQRYYVPLLPDAKLKSLDDCLIAHLDEIVTCCHTDIPSKASLVNALQNIHFAYDEYIIKEHQIKCQIIGHYVKLKRESASEIAQKQNKKIIAQRKHEYRLREMQSSELVIGTPGMFIGLSNDRISLKLYGKVQKMLPTANLSHIAITADGVTISSNAIKYCMEHGIGIDYFNEKGHHIGGFIEANSMQVSKWAIQATMDGAKRFELAKCIIDGKIRNQHNLIKYFHKYHKTVNNELNSHFDTTSKHIKKLLNQLDSLKYSGSNYRSQIMAIEAESAAWYWKYIKELLRDDNVSFDKREHKGANDLVNCMLNYGYAILYSQIWRAILSCKINPYDSVLHAHQAGKPTFVFDIIEIFRSQAVDRVVFSLIQKKEDLELKQGILDTDTRKTIAAHVFERLNRYEKFRKKEMKLCDIIMSQVRDIAAFITNETKSFKPYIAKW